MNALLAEPAPEKRLTLANSSSPALSQDLSFSSSSILSYCVSLDLCYLKLAVPNPDLV